MPNSKTGPGGSEYQEIADLVAKQVTLLLVEGKIDSIDIELDGMALEATLTAGLAAGAKVMNEKLLPFDYDNFDVADADADNERWTPIYLVGAEGGSANINTTTAGKMRIAVQPDATPTLAIYANINDNLITSKVFETKAGFNCAFGTPAASVATVWATGSLGVGLGADYLNNFVSISRESATDAPGNRTIAKANFGGVAQVDSAFTTAVTNIAFKIERHFNIYRCYYSLTKSPDEEWVLLTQYEDAAGALDESLNAVVAAMSPGSAETQTAIIDVDNFIINTLGSDVAYNEVAGSLVDLVSAPFVEGVESLIAYSQTGYYHIHGASFLYPDKAIPVQLTANAAAWNETGDIEEIIPANTITKTFDLHWGSITSISATLDGVIDIFSGASGSEVKIASIDVSRTSNFSRENAMPVQVPQQVANARISARFTSSTTNADTVSLKVYGHVYATSL